MEMTARSRTVAVDFDGVIHRYSKGWHDGTVYDRPVPGAIEALRALLLDYAVFVHTSRDPQQIVDWLGEYSIPAIREAGPDEDNPGQPVWVAGVRPFWDDQSRILVTNRKLPAVAYIDDRGIRFESWPQARAQLDRLAPVPPRHVW
jgi:hypothetical protein